MLHLILEQRVRLALAAVLPEADPDTVLVRPCPDPRFGDYQTTSLIALAKARKMNPRQLAQDVLDRLDVTEWCDAVELAGAGFLNFRIKPSALALELETAAQGGPLFFRKAAKPRTVIIDFSSPNVAKAMHVGHIRSTILGDCIARVLRLLGHHVITDNHLGDWGTQFGMLLAGWKTLLDETALAADALGELERIYKRINAQCDETRPEFNPAVRDQARQELVKLQSGDPGNMAIWRQMIELSRRQFEAVYSRLDISFDHTLGESFYHPRLPGVVNDLLEQGIARASEGAIAVFSEGASPAKQDPFLTCQEGEWRPNPFLIRKQDGGFNYATTDLATLAYRIETWDPDEIVYVTDHRQQLHFQQLFATFRRWRPEVHVNLVHIWFGSILGAENKPLRTRDGGTVKLMDLLDEAEERAFQLVTEKNPGLPEGERRHIARLVGIGAVKYADLLPNRQSDYVFLWEKMLTFTGNTAPYLQYAGTRIRSIFRKLEPPALAHDSPSGGFVMSHPDEIVLGKQLLNFGVVLEGVVEEYRPNYLCNYLYDLAGNFARFYENCPVLQAEPRARPLRLALCDLTGRVLEKGLELLGIRTLEQM